MDDFVDVNVDSKKLALELKANEAKYISGELDLNDSLRRTDDLYNKALAHEQSSASDILHDSYLMQQQTRIAKQRAKYYKPGSLVFNPIEFSIKLREHFCKTSMTRSEKGASSRSENECSSLWMKMGEAAKSYFCTAPTFNFLYGTFDPDPVEVVKKTRMRKTKDKVGDLSIPQTIDSRQIVDHQDMILEEAQRVFSILINLLGKSDNKAICYFEFVTDPTSFSRTVENMFILSFLLKEGQVCLVEDGNGMPYLTRVTETERQERNRAATKQCVISINMDEWEEIVKTFKLKTPLIHRKSHK